MAQLSVPLHRSLIQCRAGCCISRKAQRRDFSRLQNQTPLKECRRSRLTRCPETRETVRYTLRRRATCAATFHIRGAQTRQASRRARAPVVERDERRARCELSMAQEPGRMPVRRLRPRQTSGLWSAPAKAGVPRGAVPPGWQRCGAEDLFAIDALCAIVESGVALRSPSLSKLLAQPASAQSQRQTSRCPDEAIRPGQPKTPQCTTKQEGASVLFSVLSVPPWLICSWKESTTETLRSRSHLFEKRSWPRQPSRRPETLSALPSISSPHKSS